MAWKRKRCKQYSTSHLHRGGVRSDLRSALSFSPFPQSRLLAAAGRARLRGETCEGMGTHHIDRPRRKQSALSHSRELSRSRGSSEKSASGAHSSGTVHLPRDRAESQSTAAATTASDSQDTRELIRCQKLGTISLRPFAPGCLRCCLHEPAVEHMLRLPPEVRRLQPIVVVLTESPHLQRQAENVSVASGGPGHVSSRSRGGSLQCVFCSRAWKTRPRLLSIPCARSSCLDLSVTCDAGALLPGPAPASSTLTSPTRRAASALCAVSVCGWLPRPWNGRAESEAAACICPHAAVFEGKGEPRRVEASFSPSRGKRA